MELIQKHCTECGAELTMKELSEEGEVPYCPACGEFRFPMYNVAVSMIVISKADGRILLIQQYGRQQNILVAGYVNRGESVESAVKREIKEELGIDVTDLKFNRTRFYEPSNTLMCNFTVWTDRADSLRSNSEIDAYNWFTPDEAKKKIKPGSLAEEFLSEYLGGE